jgi:hypothetical protein
MIWRLIKDFKSDIVFSACFDFDTDAYYIYIYIFLMHNIFRNFITKVPHVQLYQLNALVSIGLL